MKARVWSMTIVLAATVLVWQAATPGSGQPSPYKLPPGHAVAGKPWTSIIPDPDKFDWPTQGARPGYEYRGMTDGQRRFYDYIQQKRGGNKPLSEADQAMIRRLISSRRWPEPPRPNAFWSSYMRYLRNLDTLNLNLPQSLMLSELRSRGLVPVDRQMTPEMARVRDYLNSGPFQARNWFERTFGRVEPWMDGLYSGYGYDLRPPAPAANTFPGTPFNGLQVTYDISGATLTEPKDTAGFTWGRNLSGVLHPGTLSASGTVHVGGYGATITARVWAGDKEQKKSFYVKNEGSASGSFNVSVPVPAGCKTGGFLIKLDGDYSMGGGYRGVYVSGNLGPSAAEQAADRAAADAAWRAQVEDTLRRLGYENTPEGKALDEMRAALHGGDAAWKAYVDRKLKELGYDSSPKAAAYAQLEAAMDAGGDQWRRYQAGTGTPPPPPPGNGTGTGATPAGTSNPPVQSLPDLGKVALGTGVQQGVIQNEAGSFVAPAQLSCKFDFQSLPENSTATATWTRDGKDVINSKRTIGGTGWVSFSLLSGGTSALTPGAYTLTIRIGDQIVGRRSFTVKAR